MIRLATIDDYEDIERIAEQVHRLHVSWRPDIYIFEKDIFSKEMFKKLIEDGKVIVEFEDNIVKGFLMYSIRNYDIANQVKRTVYFVDAIAVDEKYRGQGIGHKLLDYLKNIAKEKNLHTIELQVNAENKQAKEMYDKYGFTDKSINMELKL